MKKVILIGIIIVFLTGCSGLYNISNFVLPNDDEFINTIKTLDTPKKICNYMENNFEYKFYPFKILTPYELFLYKKGDCDNFATFAIFVANFHGYETYQIEIYFSDTFIRHRLAVYVENNKYTFSSNIDYYPWLCESFIDVIKCYTNDYKSYKVYDYDMNIIEQGENN